MTLRPERKRQAALTHENRKLSLVPFYFENNQSTGNRQRRLKRLADNG